MIKENPDMFHDIGQLLETPDGVLRRHLDPESMCRLPKLLDALNELRVMGEILSLRMRIEVLDQKQASKRALVPNSFPVGTKFLRADGEQVSLTSIEHDETSCEIYVKIGGWYYTDEPYANNLRSKEDYLLTKVLP